MTEPFDLEQAGNHLRLPDGRQLAWWEYGMPDGRPTLYCHGYPSSHHEALLLQPGAAQTGARILSPDRPGYGESSLHPGRTLRDWPGDVAALLDHLGLAQVDLIGVSGGGPYALACLAEIPERIRAATLVCPLGPIDHQDVLQAMRGAVRFSLSLARRWPGLATRLYGGPVPRLLAWRSEIAAAVRYANATDADRAVFARPDIDPILDHSIVAAMQRGARGARQDLVLYTHPWHIDFNRISHPLKIWHGDIDTTVPLAHARWYAEHLPHAQLTILPGEGHYSLPILHAERILRALAATGTDEPEAGLDETGGNA